jgi:transposase
MIYIYYMTVKINDPHVVMVLQDEIQRSDEARYDHRLHAILLVAKGMTCPAVAEFLGDAERTVRYWVRRYLSDGLQGLIEDERSGRPRRLSEKQMQKIGNILRGAPADAGLRGAIWDGKTLSAYVRKEFGVMLGARQCQRIFRYLDFRLRKPRSLIAHANPDLQRAFKKNSEG